MVLGHAEYYPRFGYRLLADFDLTLPFDVPSEYCFAHELVFGSLSAVSGRVVYPPVFFE